jgi:SAM-dependent methyltransferase
MARDALELTVRTTPPSPSPSLLRAATPDRAWRSLVGAACTPYRAIGRWPWHWAHGKLGRDPAFRALLEQGLIADGARIVDIGCGQGLIAALLHGVAHAAAHWPTAWPPAAHARSYTGIDLMAVEVARAKAALGALPLAPRFVCSDLRDAGLPACDLVVILDVLHYVDHAAQDALLVRVRDALCADDVAGASRTMRPSRRLLLRVGDAGQARGFAISQWVDRIVTTVRGHRQPPSWGRSLAQWIAGLQALGFTVQSQPMSRGTPFANVLLVADLVEAPVP